MLRSKGHTCFYVWTSLRNLFFATSDARVVPNNYGQMSLSCHLWSRNAPASHIKISEWENMRTMAWKSTRRHNSPHDECFTKPLYMIILPHPG